MQKALNVILVISLILNVSLIYKQVKTNSDTSEIVILKERKDSIKERIDTTFIKINNNNKEYEKDRYVIVNNSVSDDYIFFTEYLENNRRRYDSINNSQSIKGD